MTAFVVVVVHVQDLESFSNLAFRKMCSGFYWQATWYNASCIEPKFSASSKHMSDDNWNPSRKVVFISKLGQWEVGLDPATLS